MILLSTDGANKYVLGQVIVTAAGLVGIRAAQGSSTSWVLALMLDDPSRRALADATQAAATALAERIARAGS